MNQSFVIITSAILFVSYLEAGMKKKANPQWAASQSFERLGDDYLVCTEWYENGSKRVEVKYKNPPNLPKDYGVAFLTDSTGDNIVFYMDRMITLQGEEFKPIKVGGEYVWYENGQISRDYYWKEGKMDGRWREWYKNGQKKWEGTYKNGERIGKWTYYNEDGSTREVKDYSGE